MRNRPRDPVGVIRGFAEHVPTETGCHLVYTGPSVDAIADDPEGVRMLNDSIAARALLPSDARRRIHLATLPMEDLDENAIMVNALQRHARIVAQKSLAEGFGLTVAEAMWKGRPVVASRVGGIEEQIVDGESGILLDDARSCGVRSGDHRSAGGPATRRADGLRRSGAGTRPLPQRTQPARLPGGDRRHPRQPHGLASRRLARRLRERSRRTDECR